MDLEYGKILVDIAREIQRSDLHALCFLAPTRCPNFGIWRVNRDNDLLSETLDFFSYLQNTGSFSYNKLLEEVHDLLQAASRQDLANKISDFLKHRNDLINSSVVELTTDGASSNNTDSSSSAVAHTTSEGRGDGFCEESLPKPSNEEENQDAKDTARNRKREKKKKYKQKKKQMKANQESANLENDEQKDLGTTSPATEGKGTNKELAVTLKNNQEPNQVFHEPLCDAENKSTETSNAKAFNIDKSNINTAISKHPSAFPTLPTDIEDKDIQAGVTKNIALDHDDSASEKGNTGTVVTNQQDSLNAQSFKTSEEASKDETTQQVEPNAQSFDISETSQDQKQNRVLPSDSMSNKSNDKTTKPDQVLPSAQSHGTCQDKKTKGPDLCQVLPSVQPHDTSHNTHSSTIVGTTTKRDSNTDLNHGEKSPEISKDPKGNSSTTHSWYILVLCDKWHGWGNSVTVFNRELCLALARAGHCVACLVLNSSEDEREEARKGNVELISCPETPGFKEDDPQRFQFLDGALPFAPDLVVGHGKVTGPAAVFYSKKKKALRLHVLHDLPDEYLKYDNIVDKQCNEEELATSADFVAAIGTLLHQTWSAVLNRDVMEIIPGLPNLETRNSILSPVDRYFVPTKFCSPLASGLSIAVEAVNQSSRRNKQPRKPFLMIRNTDNRSTKSAPKVLKEIDKKCVDWNPHQQPERKQALIDLQGATLFLSPSRTEAFGVSALDAIAIGIPIVVSSRSGLAHTISKHLPDEFHDCVKDVMSECSGGADDDYEDDDAEVWANSIDEAYCDRRRAFSSAEALRKKWKTMFTWDKAAQLIEDTIFKSGKLPSRTEKQHDCFMSNNRIPDSTLTLVESLRLFDKRQKFVLVLSPCETTMREAVHLGLVQWVAVFDFNQSSATNGHLKMCENFLENTGKPACRMLPPCQKEEVKKLPNGIPWILLQGMSDLPRSIDNNLDWIHEILMQIKKAYSCPVTVLTVWSTENENKRLYKQLSDVLTVFRVSPFWKNAVQMKFISTTNTVNYRLEDIAEEWQTEIEKVTLIDFFRAIHSTAISVPSYDTNVDFSLPKLDEDGNIQHKALPQSMRWVDSVLELLYVTVGDHPEHGIDDLKHFYRGGKISWYGIEMNYAVERESWKPIKNVIEREIKFAGAASLTLHHQRGTGGTTSARKILYDFHLQYPCVCLQTINHETFLALKVIWEFCSLPILILTDLKDVPGADVYDIDVLYNSLSNDKISCLIMHIVHQNKRQQLKSSNTHLLAKSLTSDEQQKFYQVYSSQCPQKRSSLRKLEMDKQLQTPFYYGLVAFDDEFKGLEPFVKDCLEGLNDAQMLAMYFLGMALYYGQKLVPLSSLAGIFSLKPRQLHAIDDILPSKATELLIEDACGSWRPRHHTIGKEIVCQLLTRPHGINKHNWKLHLARKTIELISLVDEELISAILLNRISDENTFKKFSTLIEDIHDEEDVIKVFKEAIKAHPENPFFQAHLGRFYSVKMGIEGFDDALRSTDEGILLATSFSRNVRSQLTQMKGIVYKRQVKNKIDKKASLDNIIPLAIDGVKAFTSAVGISPDKHEDACIPQVRMMCDIFQHIDRTEKGGLFQYLKSKEAHPFILSSITDTSDVLETVSDSIHYPDLRKSLFRLGYRRQNENKEELIAHFKELKETNKTSIASINRQIVILELELCKDKYKAISKIAGELLHLLEEALKHDEKINLTMRLWIKVAPHIPVPLNTAESKIATWCSKGKSVTSSLYRYIVMCIRVLEGGTEEYEDELKKMWHQLHEAVHSTSRDNLPHADSPVVFLGHGKGMGQLVLVEERVKEVRKKRTVPDEYHGRCRKLTGTITKTGKVGQIQAQGLTVSFRADLCEPTPLLGESYLAKKVKFCLAFTHFGADGYNVRIIAD